MQERLGGKILIATSSHDEFGLTEPALAFSAKLRARSIEHTLDVTDAGHLEGGNARTEKAIRFVVAHLAPAAR